MSVAVNQPDQPLPVPPVAVVPSLTSGTPQPSSTPSVVVNSTVVTGGNGCAHAHMQRPRYELIPDNLRYAFLGAVAFQPAPPPVAPRNETLPVVTPAPAPTAPPATQPSALESLQETVKTLTTTMMQMMDKLKEIITGVAANKAAPQSAATPSTTLPTGSTLSRGMKFEWRAHSGHDGKLVILIPKSMNNATDVKILSPDRSSVLATGRKDGLTADKQAQIRFDQTGESYPAGSIVQFTDSSGKLWEVTIPSTSGRYPY